MPRQPAQNKAMRQESIATIIATSTKLFAEKGFFCCKMVDIAKAANMSVGNLYWYYKGKEDVLRAVLRAGFDAQKKVLVLAQETRRTSEERLNFLITAYIAMCREHNDFFTIVLTLLGNGGVPYIESLGFNLSDIGLSYHRLLLDLIDQRHDGRTQSSELSPMLFFSLFFGMMLLYGEGWHGISEEEVRAAVKRLINW